MPPKAGVVYCIEPLARPDADFVNTLAEAAAIVRRIGVPALRTMIDTSAAGRMEKEPVAELIRRWMPTGLVAHVQLNDRNRRGPGEGADRFAPVMRALARNALHGLGGDGAVPIPPGRPDLRRALHRLCAAA